MPEHSETTPTPCFGESTKLYTVALSAENGAATVAACVASLRQRSATWIVTTTTPQGNPEVWRVQVTKDATP